MHNTMERGAFRCDIEDERTEVPKRLTFMGYSVKPSDFFTHSVFAPPIVQWLCIQPSPRSEGVYCAAAEQREGKLTEEDASRGAAAVGTP